MLNTPVPMSQAVVVTPSDTTDVPLPNDRSVMRGFQVNVAGNVSVNMEGVGTSIVLAVLAGTYYPYSIARFRATGTTATGITAFFS